MRAVTVPAASRAKNNPDKIRVLRTEPHTSLCRYGCLTIAYYFHPLQSGPFSPAVQQGFGTMLIMLRKGITLQQGTFTAVIAPEPVILSALNDNPDVGRFLFLFLCGNYSRILTRINRTSSNFEIRRPFTADQLLTALKEASHTVIFIEHDPTLFDGADRLLAPVAAALREAGHGALVILYSGDGPVLCRTGPQCRSVDRDYACR